MKLTAEEFDRVREWLQKFCGISLSSQKEYLIHTRLDPVLQQFELASYSELLKAFESGASRVLIDEVIEAITTKETSFNRDQHPFEQLKSEILPRLLRELEDRKRRSGIPSSRCRIWSMPASTGQEPYSIAMAIRDFLDGPSGSPLAPDNFWILATDISERALQIARSGIYSPHEVDRGVTAEQKQRYFSPHQGRWEIAPHIRSMVEFRRVNILESLTDLTGFDLIFCRNLLIYFDLETQHKVIEKLCRSLAPRGLLLLGAAEHLPSRWETTFQTIHLGKTTLFQKTAG